MSDASCPYCDADIDINHDDGAGYDESEIHQQECSNCERIFVFETSISFSYELSKADCLNGSDHSYKKTHTHPVEYTRMRCEICGYERALTELEKGELLKGEKI